MTAKHSDAGCAHAGPQKQSRKRAGLYFMPVSRFPPAMDIRHHFPWPQKGTIWGIGSVTCRLSDAMCSNGRLIGQAAVVR